jgi:hypothetical protein
VRILDEGWVQQRVQHPEVACQHLQKRNPSATATKVP